MRILYQGHLASSASAARIGRGYLRAFLDAEHEVIAVGTLGGGGEPGFPVDDRLRWIDADAARSYRDVDVGLGFLPPPHLNRGVGDRLVGDRRANLFVCESDRVPSEWIDPLRGIDRTIVPSTFTRDALTASGLEPDRSAVVPYGFDSDAVEAARAVRDDRHDRPFTFLIIAAPHWREGIRELLSAYALAFRASDRVRLRIETTHDPARSKRKLPYEIESWHALIQQSRLHEREAPAVDVDLATRDDDGFLETYATADVYVGPSWGEAFGLEHLEAMAMGLPVIASDRGASPEWATEGVDLVDGELREAEGELSHVTPGGRVFVPRVATLVERLRWHFEHPAASRSHGDRASAHVQGRSWRASAERLLTAL